MWKRQILFFLILCFALNIHAQSSLCTNKNCRAFDFWIGDWEAFATNGNKAGDSKISLILDSCVILEEWTSAGQQKGFVFKGKSFNTYNSASKQWQQTWVDNTGNTTEFLRGSASDGQIIFYADKVISNEGKSFMRRLTFTKITTDKIRQLGEMSNDDGLTWTIEYDLEYRRK